MCMRERNSHSYISSKTAAQSSYSCRGFGSFPPKRAAKTCIIFKCKIAVHFVSLLCVELNYLLLIKGRFYKSVAIFSGFLWTWRAMATAERNAFSTRLKWKLVQRRMQKKWYDEIQSGSLSFLIFFCNRLFIKTVFTFFRLSLWAIIFQLH